MRGITSTSPRWFRLTLQQQKGEGRKGRRGRGGEEGEQRKGRRGRGGEEGEGKRAVYKTRCISSYVATAKCSRHSNIVLHNDS